MATKVLIIDDENKTRQLLMKMIDQLTLNEDLEVFAEGESVVSGLKAIKTIKPDILLLDIQMGDGTGFELLDLVDEINFKIIFITAHREYAIKAIKSAAMDYILKPVDNEELQTALINAINQLKEEKKPTLNQTSIQNNGSTEQIEKIVLKTQESVYIIDLKDIVRCSSFKNYTTFYIVDGRKIVTSKTIKEYAKVLNEPDFVRCHRSHIINMNYFERYDKTMDGMIIMKDKTEVPLSRANKEHFFKRWTK